MQFQTILAAFVMCVSAAGLTPTTAQSAEPTLDVSALLASKGNASVLDVASSMSQELCREQTFQGCCSRSGGIENLQRDGTLLCKSGRGSATCQANVKDMLRGCCTGYDGFNYAQPDGTIICNNGKVSPTCKLTKSECDQDSPA
ncbi:MAG: hypothetical protein AB7P23_01710 [Amphiplicatus sp.]